MINRNHKLSLTKQAKIIGISRRSIYYKPKPVSKADLTVMRRIDELHLSYPLAGSRMLRGLLRGEGFYSWCKFQVCTVRIKNGKTIETNG